LDQKPLFTAITVIPRICPLAPLSPPNTNYTQNQGKSSGGIASGGVGIIYTAEQISLPRDPQTQAQTSKGGGSGDVGDIFSMSSKVCT